MAKHCVLAAGTTVSLTTSTTQQSGEGAAPDPLFLLGGLGPDAFFQSNVGLDFDEDSPHFRRRLRAMDENVEGVRRHLQRLVGIVQRYIEAGQAFSAVGREFASELMHLVCAYMLQYSSFNFLVLNLYIHYHTDNNRRPRVGSPA
jgi:hypothetical protein